MRKINFASVSCSSANKIFSLLISLSLTISCNSQNIIQSKNSQNKPDTIQNGSATILKNYFITEFPQEYFSVQCGLQDKAGNMWFGTGGNGIYFYDGKSFTNFNHKTFLNFVPKGDLNHNDILCCLEDKTGKIWFGTRKGLILYKPSGGKPENKDFTNLLITQNTISSATHTKLPYTYKTGENMVHSIMEDKTGKIWFGTVKDVYIFDPITYSDSATPVFTRFLENKSISNKDSLKLQSVTSMVQDKEGNIWFVPDFFSKGEGVCRYDGKSIISFKPNGISSSFRSIMIGKDGNLYFLNVFKGVYSYDGKTFSNFTNKIGLLNDTLISMIEDKNGNFWFGTNRNNVENGGDGGVWRYDGKSLKLFTTKDGLSHDCVFSITEDRDGNIWFGTRFTGLCRYNGTSFTDFTDR